MDNKIVRISLSGGIIGLLSTNPAKTLENVVQGHNAEGYRCLQITPHRTHNALVFLLQLVVLVCTIGLWTWGGGYLILMEKK